MGLCLLFVAVQLTAQIEFFVEQSEQDTYIVALESQADWDKKDQITITAQVTLVVPKDFELLEIENMSGEWANNSSIVAPEENPNVKYLTFGLISLATREIKYEKNKATPLFLIKGQSAEGGELKLIDKEDSFSPPNSLNINVGNQLTTLGSGNKNAWTGNKKIKIELKNTLKN